MRREEGRKGEGREEEGREEEGGEEEGGERERKGRRWREEEKEKWPGERLHVHTIKTSFS